MAKLPATAVTTKMTQQIRHTRRNGQHCTEQKKAAAPSPWVFPPFCGWERGPGHVRRVGSCSVGVEEEFLLVVPEPGQPRAVAETAAERAGVRAAALTTSPVPVEPKVVGTSRYRRMADVFGLTAHEQLTCGCHVHVKAASRMRTEVLRLAALLARGNGAAYQRAVHRRSGSLPEVIRRAVAVTGDDQPR